MSRIDFGDSRSARDPWLERTSHLVDLKDEEIKSSSQVPRKGEGDKKPDADLVQIIDAAESVLRAKDEDILQIGGRLQGNADVELAMPCTSLYTAEWHGLSNCELEDKLCHGTIYLADREAQIEATWRKRQTVTRLDDCTQEYRLRVRLNTEKPEADNELDTLSSDSNSHQGSGDEWDSTLSSGGESEYNPKRRSRQHTAVNKRSGERVGEEYRISKLEFLFMWDDGKERREWESKPYRVIFQKSFELIERRQLFITHIVRPSRHEE
mgnify:CR=1 FL=1